jgi:type I restriction enzyme S subunit
LPAIRRSLGMVGDAVERTTFAKLVSQGALEIGDGYRAKNEELGGNGLIFLRAGHVTDTHIDFEGVERFHVDLEPRVRSKCAKPGDAVVTTKGNSTGRTTFVTDSMPPFVYSPHLSYWRSKDPTRIAGGFLRYWSKSHEFVDQLAGMKGSTDMAPYLSLVDQKRLLISLPPITEQRAIAHILGTLDDKIELNRRMNETLEAMARALFNSWFVDFDPVRAKAEGSDPGLSKSLADLFPDSFGDSDLGKIPKGWCATRWGALVTLEYGKSLGGYAADDGAYPVYGTNGKIGSHSTPLCGHPGIVIGRKGVYRGVHFCSTPFFVIDTGFYVEPKVPVELRWAYYELLGQDINSMDSGSAIPSTSREDFYSMPVVSPPFEVQKAFVRLLTPCWVRQDQNNKESHALATLRDALLPKLISGELRVKAAESFLETQV